MRVVTSDNDLIGHLAGEETPQVIRKSFLTLADGTKIPILVTATPKWQEEFIRRQRSQPVVEGTAIRGMKLRRLERTSIACPSQWDAETEDGRILYIRYRYGCLQVDMGGCGGETVYCQHVGNEMDGFMEDEEMLELTGMALVDQAN